MVAPMCKIADDMKPPDWQISVLRGLARMGPTWPIAPVPDVLDRCFKVDSCVHFALCAGD